MRKGAPYGIGLVAGLTAVSLAVPPEWLASRRQAVSTATSRSADDGLRIGAPSPSAQSRGGVVFYDDTGADNCNDVTIIPLTLGTPSDPDYITITGDNTLATGPDCSSLSTLPAWWEAFQIDECADIVISFCGTSPVISPIFLGLQTACPVAGTNCGTRISQTSNGIGAPVCSDGNRWVYYQGLPAGTYYYPVRSDSFQGPYQLNITASVCSGACCDFAAGNCTDGSWPAACSGPDQQFQPGGFCCTLECLPPNQTYASKGVELLSHLDTTDFIPGGGAGNDVWGYVSPSGREYAILGMEGGTGFAEVTDPFNPVVVGTIPHFSPVWRDMKTHGQYAYSVNDFNGGGMQVINLSQIDNGIVTLHSSLTASGLETSHNVAVNNDSAHVYLCGSNLSGGGLVSVDVADPANPVIDGNWSDAYVHDALIITYDDGPFAGREIGFLFGTGQVFYIVDLTNKANILIIATLPFVPAGFGHQGWITEDRRYVIFGAESCCQPTTTYVINVEDLNNPFFVNTYNSGVCVYDHNMMIRGRFAYHANYTSGLRVFDVLDPPNAQQVAFFDTHPEGQQGAFQGAWGIYAGFPSGIVLISDMNRGLFVFNYDCNVNGLDDTDDIAAQVSADCNANGLPDECESNLDGDGVPEVCELHAEPGGADKNRFISLLFPPPGAVPAQTAIRVRLDSLHHPPGPPDAPDFSSFEGEYRYVNAYRDGQDNPVFDCVDSSTYGTSFKCAKLGCEPEYRDWHAAMGGSVLHVTGTAVIPSSQYSAALIPSLCQGDEIGCPAVTYELGLGTTRWGDVLTGELNVIDVSDIVDKVKELPTAQGEPNGLLRPHEPLPMTDSVNVLDVSEVVDALKESAYPFPGPEACP